MGRDEFRIKIALTYSYSFIWNFFRLVLININKTEKKKFLIKPQLDKF